LDAARRSLIDAYTNQALMQKHKGQTAAEESSWARVAEQQAKRVADFPDQPDRSADLARTLYTLAGLRMDQPTQSMANFREAYDAQRTAFRQAPNRTDLQANLGLYGAALVEALTNSGDHAGAFKAAHIIVADMPSNWSGLPKVAGNLSQCLRAARSDTSINDEQRSKVVTQYGAEALGVLRRAVSGGFKESALLESAPELAALRESPEFKEEFAKLLESIRR
jgi:hypothetical protein